MIRPHEWTGVFPMGILRIGMLCVPLHFMLTFAHAQDDRTAWQRGDMLSPRISICPDPNCAGCCTFLASYGPTEAPSCRYSADAADSTGGPWLGEGGDGGLGEQLLDDDFGAGYGYLSSAPNMIGDFFSGGYTLGPSFEGERAPGIPIAGGDRRFKISENVSPFPRDRVYFTYNLFKNAVATVEGRELDLNRYTFGAEKTFLAGMASIELRLPFAAGLSSDQVFDGNPANDAGTEFGNLTLVPKIAIASSDWYLVSTGLGINLPTARDGTLATPGGVTTVVNEAVHLMPFVGLLLTPNDAFYAIAFAQADFDVNGNPVLFNGFPSSTLQEQSLLHLDMAIGRWIYRNEGSRLSGIAPQMELHYTTTMQDPDMVAGLSNFVGRMDTLTLTAGMNFQFFDISTLTVACAAPLRGAKDQEERPFDVELQVFFNRGF